MRENRTCSLSGGRRPAPAPVGAPPPTRLKVKGEDKYLYRAVDSTGQTIDFLLTAKRDAAGAKRFFQKALQSPGNPSPREVNVDKNPAYPAAIEALKAERMLPRRVRLRQCK